MVDVPILFCFDDRILCGAGVSILSLVDSAATDTTYKIQIFHPGFSKQVQDGLSQLIEGSRHTITFHKISDERFQDVPRNRGSWTDIVYYRLLASDVLTQFEKVIYSDVDVFFFKDLAEVFATDLTGYDWAGVAAEANVKNSVLHRHFPENQKDIIYFSGFMVMNLDRMREVGAVARYFEIAREQGDRLKFFDLDILNIASQSIRRIPFNYCVLEDTFEIDDIRMSSDWRYLKTVYAEHELLDGRENAAIVHYAGRRGKPWQRQFVPAYYGVKMTQIPAILRRGTFRDWRKRWLSRKGRRRFDWRSSQM